jgi:hypothetical protein
MLNCWKLEPNERPDFNEIDQFFTQLLKDATCNYGYVESGLNNANLAVNSRGYVDNS